MFQLIRVSIVMLLLLTIATGVIYPLAMTAVAQVVFPNAASGSVMRDGDASDSVATGSELIGQSFTDPKYFFGRPSVTSGFACNPACGAASNLAPSNPALRDVVITRIAALHAADPGNRLPVPMDLVTASASGLDPHISEAAADYQIARVARVRGLDEARVRELVTSHLEPTGFGLGSRSCVNVLKLNLALDGVDSL